MCYYVDVVFSDEFLCEPRLAVVIGERNGLVHSLTGINFFASFLCCHDGLAFVLHAIFIGHDTNVQAVSKAERRLEKILVAFVAKVVDTVTVHIRIDREQREIHVVTEFGNDRDIVEGSEGKNDEIVEDGCHAHQHNPWVYPPLRAVCNDDIVVNTDRKSPSQITVCKSVLASDSSPMTLIKMAGIMR
eukprot:CAMPEP_0173065014 /NCGR_PEP_ID=MMETSP1102-20130122/5349_1 /TAXON_ID=49646 /ORGANISM="Geminigera sp., Strain Caron Lab Isolate" /LENGTH=187 /DNA_ID=CAMNT_0013932171 /DNA_START=516 /DNA_END=1080 /DNA_ORIENTATION=-